MVKAFDDGSKARSFGHCLVAGVDRAPLKVTRHRPFLRLKTVKACCVFFFFGGGGNATVFSVVCVVVVVVVAGICRCKHISEWCLSKCAVVNESESTTPFLAPAYWHSFQAIPY